MPLLAAKGLCDEQAPCRRNATRCARCAALDGLVEDDWYIITFYRRVDDQFINQTPMGGSKDAPPLLTVRLEGYEAALRLYGYPRRLWPWLTDWARYLHRLHRGLEKPQLTDERREHYRRLGVEA